MGQIKDITPNRDDPEWLELCRQAAFARWFNKLDCAHCHNSRSPITPVEGMPGHFRCSLCGQEFNAFDGINGSGSSIKRIGYRRVAVAMAIARFKPHEPTRYTVERTGMAYITAYNLLKRLKNDLGFDTEEPWQPRTKRGPKPKPHNPGGENR
jgi:hypothetical protein